MTHRRPAACEVVVIHTCVKGNVSCVADETPLTRMDARWVCLIGVVTFDVGKEWICCMQKHIYLDSRA